MGKDGLDDKVKHCAISCELARRCGPVNSYLVGGFKELYDALPGNDSDASLVDILADDLGIQFSPYSCYSCLDLCNAAKSLGWLPGILDMPTGTPFPRPPLWPVFDPPWEGGQ